MQFLVLLDRILHHVVQLGDLRLRVLNGRVNSRGSSRRSCRSRSLVEKVSSKSKSVVEIFGKRTNDGRTAGAETVTTGASVNFTKGAGALGADAAGATTTGAEARASANFSAGAEAGTTATGAAAAATDAGAS